jgi:predicted DNA-binding ribbon-helix-helix protein
MEASAARQRILQADGRRYSLKLEPAFWTALAAAADERGVKLGRLVADLAAQAPRGSNLASQLRLFCLAEAGRLRQRADEAARRAGLSSGSTDVDTLVEICPAPCLILARDRRILRANAAFGGWYGSAYVNLPGKALDHFFKLRMATGYEALVAAFGAGQINATRAHLLYVAPGRVVAAAARLMPVARSGPDDFLILVMIGDGTAPDAAAPGLTSR